MLLLFCKAVLPESNHCLWERVFCNLPFFVIQKKVPVKMIPFTMVVEENAHQIPFSPKEVFPRIIANGILELVKRILMILHKFVLPSPDIAPMVVSSIHKNASLNPMMTR